MSSKLNLGIRYYVYMCGIRYAYIHGGAAWGLLTDKGRYGVVFR